MSDILDSRQLRAFSTLARTGSFTNAAKELHLSQSAVSHAMKAFEDQIGCRLFDRLGKKVALTQAGEQLLVRADRILREMSTAREEIARLGKWGTSRLRLGASSTACEYILPAVLREFKESFADCRITIEPCDSAESIQAVRDQRVDLVIALEPRGEAGLEFRPLFTDELMFVVNPLHPWALAGRVKREEIRHQTYIVYNKASATSRMIEHYFAAEDIVLPTSIELGSMDAIKELVKLGIGVSILAEWVARDELGKRSLVGLSLGRRKLKRTWGIVHLARKRLTLAEETFVGLCRAVVRDLR